MKYYLKNVLVELIDSDFAFTEKTQSNRELRGHDVHKIYKDNEYTDNEGIELQSTFRKIYELLKLKRSLIDEKKEELNEIAKKDTRLDRIGFGLLLVFFIVLNFLLIMNFLISLVSFLITGAAAGKLLLFVEAACSYLQ